MKKIISCIILFFTLISSTIAESEPTSKVNAFECMDMYAKRISDFADIYHVDASHGYDIMGYYSMPPLPYPDENVYSVHVPAGTIFVSVPGFEIVRADVLIASNPSDDQKAQIQGIRAAMFYSALEYSSREEERNNLLMQINPDSYPELVTRAYVEFYDAYYETIENQTIITDLLEKSGNTVPFLSGNYEYSLQFIQSEYEENKYESMYLIAEARDG